MSPPRKKSAKNLTPDDPPHQPFYKRGKTARKLSRSKSVASLSNLKKKFAMANVSDSHEDTDHNRPSTLSGPESSETPPWSSFGQVETPTMSQKEPQPGGSAPAFPADQPKREQVTSSHGFNTSERPKSSKRERPGPHDTAESNPSLGSSRKMPNLSPLSPRIENTRRVRTGWRPDMSLAEFGQLAGWSSGLIESARPKLEVCGTVATFVQEVGREYIRFFRENYQAEHQNLAPQVDFPAVEALRHESRAAHLAAFTAEMLKLSIMPVSFRFGDFHNVLLELYPSNVASQSGGWKDRVEEALRTGLGGKFSCRPNADYVQDFWDTVEDYFNHWRDSSLAPYTSLVAPMGTGKTRAFEELARRGLCYVSYFNATTKKSFVSPSRSLIANYMDKIRPREELTVFFESYVASILEQVTLCQQLGITPKLFFDIQALDEFENTQLNIAENVWELYEMAKSEVAKETARSPDNNTPRTLGQRVRSDSIGEGKNTSSFMRRTHVDRFLPDHRKAMRKVFLDVIKGLPGHLLRPGQPNAELEDGKLECIICLDEAAQLFHRRPNETLDQSRFGAWRRALRHRATTEDGKKKRLQFFGVVTDTTAQVSHLSPPRVQDPSLAASSKLEDLFHPLWEVDSFDVLADRGLYAIDHFPTHNISPSDDYHRKLFSFGRPLLGALLSNTSISVEDVKQFLFRKVPGFTHQPFDRNHPSIRALALVSYRCQFFVTLQSLADDLCTSYLRFIADISDDRTLVRTLQPSEPLLAWLATDEMRNPEMPLEMVRALLHHTQRGFIDVGDIGELVSSIILLLTFDSAHDKAYGAGRPRPIAVSAFFKALVPDNVFKEMEKQTKKNAAIRRVWNGSVFFSHFSRTQPEDRHVTLDTLRRAYARNAALLTPNNFKGCDLILPVLLQNPRKMSYVLVQVKNDKSLVQGDAQNNEALVDLSPHATLQDPGPFMGLWMSLRGKGSSKPQFFSKTPIDVLPRSEKLLAVVSGLDDTLYLALKEKENTVGSSRIVDKLKALLECTEDINVPRKTRFFKSMYPTDDKNL